MPTRAKAVRGPYWTLKSSWPLYLGIALGWLRPLAPFLGIIPLRRTAPEVVPTGDAFGSYVDDVVARISS